jgi:adenine-specific DNA-methyltransferase
MSNLSGILQKIENEDLSREQIVKLLKDHLSGDDGIVLSYAGKAEPWQITRMVKPKITQTIQDLCVGTEEQKARNMIVEGENLSAMITLYKYRGQVDLIVTDPPYNADRDFRYNDKWDTNPDNPELGDIVMADDGSKHSKWLRFMSPRIYMMKEMLKPNGVLAICIDHRELYRLGILMDEIFGEKNRIGIINWQKAYSPKSDSTHISTATEYVLVYAKDIDRAKTGLEARTHLMNSRYKNPDNDPNGDWSSSDSAAKEVRATGSFAIQSPFTGELFYPYGDPYNAHWVSATKYMRQWLEGWGSAYEIKDIGDNIFLTDKNGKTVKAKALVLKGCQFKNGKVINSEEILKKARDKAQLIYRSEAWPQLFFTDNGEGGPRLKRHLKDVKQGKVSWTWWANDDFDEPLVLDSTSWGHKESGHSQSGIKELDAVVGKGHNFETVKPLKLIKKIIHLWCRPDGIVLDPFAGSGTTGHAIIELNEESGSDRRFILIEQGNTEKGDHYAKTLTADRLKRVITGDWVNGKQKAYNTGFNYLQIQKQHVDAIAVAELAREEMIDLLTTSYFNTSEKAKSYLTRIYSDGYLFAKNVRKEGFFLIWSPDGVSSLTREVYSEIIKQAKEHNLEKKYHVYATTAPYAGSNIEFYKIPDKVLEHLGFNATSDAYVEEV